MRRVWPFKWDENGEKLILVSHRIWKPTPGKPLDRENTVEEDLRELNEQNDGVEIFADPYQMHRSITTLQLRFHLKGRFYGREEAALPLPSEYAKRVRYSCVPFWVNRTRTTTVFMLCESDSLYLCTARESEQVSTFWQWPS